MAEFQEVIQQKNRMCQSIACRECDIYRLCSEDLSVCQGLIYNNPKKAEEIIMSWAAEHPEPVYPTWGEVLVELGCLKKGWEHTYAGGSKCLLEATTKRINKETAMKLGIEPKEG